jgi:casein kinase 1
VFLVRFARRVALCPNPVSTPVCAGSTFRATHVHTGHVVALKLQPVSIYYPTNNYERAVYPLIQGGEGMPKLWASGVLNGWDYLVIDLLGSSIDGMYRALNKGVLDIRTVLSIAVQTVRVCLFCPPQRVRTLTAS